MPQRGKKTVVELCQGLTLNWPPEGTEKELVQLRRPKNPLITINGSFTETGEERLLSLFLPTGAGEHKTRQQDVAGGPGVPDHPILLKTGLHSGCATTRRTEGRSLRVAQAGSRENGKLSPTGEGIRLLFSPP